MLIKAAFHVIEKMKSGAMLSSCLDKCKIVECIILDVNRDISTSWYVIKFSIEPFGLSDLITSDILLLSLILNQHNHQRNDDRYQLNL